jgi:hypothetical protein
MKKSAIMLSTIAGLSLGVTTIQAATSSVHVESHTSGSSNVKVNQSVSATSSSNQTGSTDIRIETNGKVKEYHGTGNQNVTISSEDGTNTASVINQVNTNTPTPSPNPSQSPSPIPVSSSSTSFSIENKDQRNILKVILEEISEKPGQIIVFIKTLFAD